MRTDAGAILTALSRWYRPAGKFPPGIFVSEIESPCGLRRADALFLTLTAAGYGLVGHEIKISRSDLIAELADPAKADPWLKYCDRWWLVVSDPAIAEGLPIPDAWGLMTPPTNAKHRAFRVLKEAPPLRPQNQAPAFRRMLKWQMVANMADTESADRKLSRLRAEKEMLERKLIDRDARAGGYGGADELIKIREIVKQAETRLAGDLRIYLIDGLDIDHVVSAIVDATAAANAAKSVRDEAERLIKELDRATEPLIYARAAVARSIAAALKGAPIPSIERDK